ncbi:hypothetical protein [Paenibacillus sp. MMO-177]|uniref:hypothetical protein n=1 Tax=Paenibacillus sp. MMO-177 TaxID=3081289 RepID=UPI0030170C81
MKMNHKQVLKIFLLSITLLSFAVPVFAAGGGVGERFGSSLTANITALIPGVLLIIAIYFMIVRDWMKMISFVGITIVVAIFTNWSKVTTIGGKVYDAFIS